MDLLDLLKLMFRRWYVSAPIVVVTLGAALAFGLAIQPEYKTEVAILLVPPTTSAAPEPDAAPRPGNPWLRIGENAMAQAVQISTSAHDARTRIAAAGGDPDYEVGLVTRSSILTIAVTASSEESARRTVEAVTQLVHDEVAGQQAPYRPNPGEQITTEVLDPGLNILPSRSNVLRAQVVILAIGLLLAAVAAVVHDAVARRRANARPGVRRDAPTPMAWNGGPAVTAGQAVVNSPRPGPAVAATPVARTAPISPAPMTRAAAVSAGREPTQAVSRRAARGPEDRIPAHPVHDRHPDPRAEDRYAGPQADDRYADPSVDDRAAAPAAEETVLLTSTARKVLDDPGR
ncbi:hypothetical protein O7626_27260 [Micromonospora sp. WMMD1102]|uniref:hypothetical protein n=1 Tax=Micromonospora sp. WMMD1102 TaxID=3016105 RepID=UPI0024156833|nr:hypothetical protein [Micromonospora sp. WMMD1102]MDG4789578.1 hypothetical protein [Micromonospora sp. WMMD1102]